MESIPVEMYFNWNSSSDSFCGMRTDTVRAMVFTNHTMTHVLMMLNMVWKSDSPYDVASWYCRNWSFRASWSGVSPSPVGADMALSVAGSSDEVNAVSWLGSPGPMVSTRCDINPVKG